MLKTAKEMYEEGWCEDCECDAGICFANGVCFASQNNKEEEDDVEELI